MLNDAIPLAGIADTATEMVSLVESTVTTSEAARVNHEEIVTADADLPVISASVLLSDSPSSFFSTTYGGESSWRRC